MATDLLQQFFSDHGRRQDYDNFLERAQRDPSSISEQEAASRYQELMRNAPPELAHEANQVVFSHLPADTRTQVAQSFHDAHNNPAIPFQGYDADSPSSAADPQNLSRMAQSANDQGSGLLGQIMGSALGRAAMAAGAAYLASRILGGQNSGSVGSFGGQSGGFGGFGGGQTDSQSGGQNSGQGGFGGLGGLGGLLGSLLGGAAGSTGGNQGGAADNTGGSLGGITLSSDGTSHRR